MSQVLDYSLARPAPADIVAAGYVGVLRYVAPAMDAPKVITQAEYDALRAAGLAVALNWEWYATRPREGALAGTVDAQAALQQADALGYTGAIYFSVDFDAGVADQPAINAYFQACAAVIGLERLGAYAGYWPLSRLFDAGLIRYGWQTLAWSGGNREQRAHLYQNGTVALGGDVDDVLKTNWTGEAIMPQGPFIYYTVGKEAPSGLTVTALAAMSGLDTGILLQLAGQPSDYNPDIALPDGTIIKLPGFPQPAAPAGTAKLVIDSTSIRAVLV